ncbi:protein of unknown function DUF1214 [Xanthobacter versatilis]|uniref:DUF1254 domain-containing protein n=1 Tax=Xanthobacter autotrophicus (strain ATCC BAA-1158 / Py2) TaxID=78245 RepID=A7ICV5_XANP2|nr:protein of unknown function DUF1214 [Xanthobacter autotrophicus Py2]
MLRNTFLSSAAALAVVLGAFSPAFAQQARFDELADLPFAFNRPTPETAKTLKEALAFQQATQAYLWAMPLINTLGMKFGSDKEFGTGYNVLPIWKQRLDPKTLVTTPNSDVLYAMSYIDMSETGPIVMDAPPGLQGILLDFWQRPIPVDGGKYFGDVGMPGPDQGKGGKFLVLPPGYDGGVPDGYYVYRSGTNNLFIFLRGFYEDPNNLTPAVERLEKTRIYPLNLPEAERKPMQFPDASGVPANMLPRTDIKAFDQLKWLIDKEGKTLAGPNGLGILASVGLVAGKPFKPDAERRALLNAAAKTGYDMSRTIGFLPGLDGVNYHVWKDRQWINPVNNMSEPGAEKSLDLDFRNKAKGYYAFEPRFWFFTNYYSISPGMVSQIPGRGAAYAIAFNDAMGKPLIGKDTYKLTLPADIPAEMFWSVTLYEAANASGLATEQRRFPSLGSRDKPVQNADGSTDLYVGPRAPEGKEANWLPTAPERGFFAILRLYGPTEAAINYSWTPGDFEKLP